MGLGLSTLLSTTLRPKTAKVTAAKRKIDEALNLVSKKVCRALGVEPDEIKTEEAIKAADHDLLMSEILKELPNASKLRKYQLLSLVPFPAHYFKVGTTLMRSVRILREERGILPDVQFTRHSTVPKSTKKLVTEIYYREDNSKVMPGSKNCVSIKKGVYEQERILLGNLSELHQSFKKECRDTKVRLTVFSSLKLQSCIFAGSAGSHVQCVCQTHQNIKLILFALNIETHYRARPRVTD